MSWLRPDAARFLAPGVDPASVYPALDRKFNPNQPRVPAGSPDGGQWTDGDETGQANGINDPRVISDADLDGWLAGEEYALNRSGSGGGRFSSSSGPPLETTPAQAARLEAVRAQATEAITRVREVDQLWRPSPSLFETAEGAIRAYEGDIAQARVRAGELAAKGLLPGPFAGESIRRADPIVISRRRNGGRSIASVRKRGAILAGHSIPVPSEEISFSTIRHQAD